MSQEIARATAQLNQKLQQAADDTVDVSREELSNIVGGAFFKAAARSQQSSEICTCEVCCNMHYEMEEIVVRA